MDKLFEKSLWLTFAMYLSVSYINTVGLASHFETNGIICNIWGFAVEVGDITLMIGTLKRKKSGKPYGLYLTVFLISLAVSIAANVLEWTNSFLGNDVIYQGLHQVEFPWVVPTLLGITIPALMLATGGMLSDLDSSSPSKPILESELQKEEKETIPKNNTGEKPVLAMETPLIIETILPVSVNGKHEDTPFQRRDNIPSAEEFCLLSSRELSIKYNVTEKTVRTWRKKYSIEKTTLPT